MIYHIPNAQIRNISYNRDYGRDSTTVFGEGLRSLQDNYSCGFQFTLDNSAPWLWDKLFGPGELPRTGITICTDVEPPSLTDLRWAYIASKVRYESAVLLNHLEELLLPTTR